MYVEVEILLDHRRAGKVGQIRSLRPALAEQYINRGLAKLVDQSKGVIDDNIDKGSDIKL